MNSQRAQSNSGSPSPPAMTSRRHRMELRLKAYGFIGAALQIGTAWLGGELSLTIDEVIDELVNLFYRISGVAPPSPREPDSGQVAKA